jgi:pyruvate dehydrogenase E1 component alpha subunit
MVEEDRDLLMEMLRRMLRIRYFEEQVVELVSHGEIVGAAHSYIGEEAVAIGACAALRDDDYITGTHRSHGHPIAKGGDVRRAMAELLGKATGYCKGKGGSMHLADFSIGILGESGIVASSMPVAVGAGLASKLRGNDRVVIAFFGDGASNQGAAHESMNLAAVWKLPVIFVCENNQYAVTTHFNTTVATENIADRAAAYNMPGAVVDGQDALAMYQAVKSAADRARAGEGPSLVEGKTYRYYDHSLGMERILRAPYRSDEEVARWRERDPIPILKEAIMSREMATEAEIELLEQEVQAQMVEAVEFARQSPYPTADQLFEDMYATPIAIE